MRHHYELAVIAGHKSGARTPVFSDRRISIGDQYDCDIVLGGLATPDSSLAGNDVPIRITLHHDSNSGVFSLQVVEGSLLLDNVTVSTGSAVEVTPGSPVEIAGSTFVISKIVQASSAPSAPIIEHVDNQPAPSVAPSSPNSAIRKFGMAATVCVAIACGSAYWIDDKYFGITAHDQAIILLQRLMVRPEYSQLELLQSGDGAIQVVGHVHKRANLQQLRNSLSGMEQTVYVDVSVGEIMAESVASVFRVNGLEAVTSSVASGEVLVKSAATDLQLLKKIEAIAYTDVAGLKSLEIENTPLPVSNDFETMPGKRIVMVVSTEPTYILTEDGSRYFTGSILPSGHKVKAILEEKVKLELDQHTIEVIF